METLVWIGLAVLVVAALVAGAIWWVMRQRRRTEHLTLRFGSEYRRVVETAGDRTTAERELEERERRTNSFEIQPLSAESRERYTGWWREIQARFVDDPSGAISAADRLLQQVMDSRGYPTADFEQRIADISVEYGDMVEEYRAAHEIAERHAATPGGLDTEALRQAMVHYRVLFDELLAAPEREPVRLGR